ncbi:hypothetical protein FXV74_10205 [Latilactobacillus sakei]|nr:hypothetical protein FXV74_10205 [Latilactobacillus sakei]UNC24117.1 hypothetical protein FX989_09985 [Latilactobacillus sakei]
MLAFHATNQNQDYFESTHLIQLDYSLFCLLVGLLCQESGHKSANKFDFQFKLLNLIFGGRSFSPVQILKTL